MKRCPDCRRDYTDETLKFCLDDGSALLDGPASGEEPSTAIYSPVDTSSEPKTELLEKGSFAPDRFYDSHPGPASISTRRGPGPLLVSGGVLALIALVAGAGFLAYKYWGPRVSAAVPFESMKIERVTTSGNATQAVILPDGKQLVYILNEDGKRSLWLRQIATGNDVRITEPRNDFNYFGLTISPDGNFLYFASGGTTPRNRTLYQLPLLGGVPQKLIDDIGTPIGISPDAKQLAFARIGSGESTLMIANADGTGERAIARRKGEQSFGTLFGGGVAWSTDGKEIISVTRNQDGDGRYFTMIAVSIDGGVERALTSQKWYQVHRIAPLPDGSGLMMTAMESANDLLVTQIWHLNYLTGDARKITNDLNNYRLISLSSDGKSLLSVQEDETSNIWVAPGGDAATAVQIKSVSGKTDGRDGVDWLSDEKLVYHSIVGGSDGVWSVDTDGKNRKQLTAAGKAGYFPSVSTDGRFIVFVVERGGMRGIWRMDPDGSNAKQVIDGRGIGNNPVASAEFIIYRTNDGLWRVPITGGEPQQISKEDLTRCAISPDGKYIACQLGREGESGTKFGIIAVDGGTPLVAFDAELSLPARIRWSADGRAVTYVSEVNAASDIWSQPIDGGKPKKLTNFQADHIFSFSWSRTNKLAVSHGTSTSDVVLIRNVQ